MSVSSDPHLRTVFPPGQIDAQSLPDDVQQRVCDVISVHERPDTQALACVNKLFKKSMDEKKHLLLVANDIKTPARSGEPYSGTAFQKQVAMLAELSPALRTKVFHLLTQLTPFPHTVYIASHCQLLWQHVHLLPASERSQAILALGKLRARISYGLLGRLIDAAPHPEQAGLLGLLSFKLKRCSDAKFPALLEALVSKVSHLSDKDQNEALVQLYQFTGSHLDTAGSRYQQLFTASQQILLTLPKHLQVLPVGVWTSPTQAR